MAAAYRLVVECDQEQRRELARLLGLLRREWGVEATAEILLRSLREVARRT